MASRFRADISAAGARAATGTFHGITSVKRGDSDVELVIKYTHSSLESPLQVRLYCQDVDNYPESSSFFIFTDTDNAPECLVAAMTDLQDFTLGLRIQETISTLAKKFSAQLLQPSGASAADPIVVDDGDAEMTDVDEFEDDDDDMDFGDDDDDDVNDYIFGLATKPGPPSRVELNRNPELKKRLKRDLRKVKMEGFKVAILGGVTDAASHITISMAIRARKLGLPEEALQAWDVKPSDYIVLLYRIDGLYRPVELVCEQPAVLSPISFCLGKCEKYKPDLVEALSAFSESNRRPSDRPVAEMSHSSSEVERKFVNIALSKSLNQFMKDSFVSLVKLRYNLGLSWDDANTHLQSQVGLTAANSRPPSVPTLAGAASKSQDDEKLPPILRRDHLMEDDGEPLSLPLVAMQFAMRYFVGCTQYCVICHRKLDGSFEALKPYVCTNPLCLFQYISLGFGPSVEHEILTQPKVVELLVCFCYSAASIEVPRHIAYGTVQYAIREFPVGLRLKVPNLQPFNVAIKGRLKLGRQNQASTEFVLANALDFDRLREGHWVAFRDVVVPPPPLLDQVPSLPSLAQFSAPLPVILRHAKIDSFAPETNSVFLEFMGVTGTAMQTGKDKPVAATAGPGVVPVAASSADEFTEREMIVYDADFDSMQPSDKSKVMIHILDTLPPIAAIQQHLDTHRHSTIRSMNSVSPAAASLLEWIVASNRSCIFQTDSEPQAQTGAGQIPALLNLSSSSSSSKQAAPADDRQRVVGMETWTTFRFVQGSADKELRFNRALQTMQTRKRLSSPTLLAWHGSSLANWHSIVRSGLDYRVTMNGRAYGNGVYFSKDFHTSRGYSQDHGLTAKWRNSAMAIDTAISLNEVINSPEDFQSQEPHYVVAQPDWHQCRFLFVQDSQRLAAKASSASQLIVAAQEFKAAIAKKKAVETVQYFREDPSRAVSGPLGRIKIPMALMPSSRRSAEVPIGAQQPGDAANDSSEDDVEDLEIFFSDDEDVPALTKDISRSSSVDTLKARMLNMERPITPAHITHKLTEFRPGSIDKSTLPHLPPPSWASTSALRHLSNEVKRLQDLQTKTPPHELGWYVDFAGMDNLFQWIVELHSFDMSLPFAQDMTRAGILSIVCELRFGPEFPISPPFARIIRPRFLPFASGGGGHVTIGGAMCLELLTSTGWLPTHTIESVLLQIRLALYSQDPRPARLKPGLGVGASAQNARADDYGIGEAVEAFQRAAHTHGWKVPADLHRVGLGFTS